MKWSILLLGIWSQFALANTLLNKNAFTDKYIAAATEKIEGFRAIKSGELEVRFEGENGAESTSFLANAYAAYENDPASLEQIIQHYSTSLAAGLQQLDASSSITSHIFPVIKDKEYIEQIRRMVQERDADETSPFYYEKLNSELFVLYVIDTPTAMTYVSEEMLNQRDIDKQALRKIAKTNLKNSVKLQTQGISDAVLLLVADGIYNASFILFDSIWNNDVFPVKGQIVVYMLARDTVLVTGSEEVAGLEEIKNITLDPDNTWPDRVSTTGFVYTSEGWRPFEN